VQTHKYKASARISVCPYEQTYTRMCARTHTHARPFTPCGRLCIIAQREGALTHTYTYPSLHRRRRVPAQREQTHTHACVRSCMRLCAHPPFHVGGGASQRSVNKLLRRLFPALPKDRALERYPPRIFLAALMIQFHPEVVFNGSGPREEALAVGGSAHWLAWSIERPKPPLPLPKLSSIATIFCG